MLCIKSSPEVLPWPGARWVFGRRFLFIFIRKRWTVFNVGLLFEEKSLRCHNGNTQIIGWALPPGVPVQLWYTDSVKRFWRQAACQGRTSSRKWGKIKVSKGRVLTEERAAALELPWIFSFPLAGIQELSSPSRNAKAKQQALMLPALSRCEQPTRAQGGRKREGGVIYFFLTGFSGLGSPWVPLLYL